MKYLIFLGFLSVVQSSVYPIGVTVGLSERNHPIVSMYHAQDNYGQYAYGYATPTSTKSETKTADGVTQGGYSYIDSNGILQSVHYVADPVHGFRVAATNLPQDLPEVAWAKAKHLAEYNAISAEHASARVAYSNPVAVPIHEVRALPQPVQDLPEVARARAEHLAVLNAAYAAQAVGANIPQVVQDLPEVQKARLEHLATVESIKQRDAVIRAQTASLSPIPNHFEGSTVPVHTRIVPTVAVAQAPKVSYVPALWNTPISSQYHAQDNWGQYMYGYVSPLSSKSETRTADGVTTGGYSYIDANGVLQTVNYVADAVHGFRVAASNLPH
ncbi:unnamed protein product [Brassicogethes aeneus]|uniref:Cuticle protein 6 n=1 Tax=Brassicogethes aeneus TaxID=1431903 RepID=A0A9P0B3Q0_BRAAE|nr:unnamed protein product [Brassicogethes aeneus]